MEQHCQIPNIIGKLLCGGQCQIAYIGGSVTQGRGSSNTAETSWRALFQKYLYKQFHSKYYCHIGEIYAAMGGCFSGISAFMLQRNVLTAEPGLAFVEFCLNDRHIPDKTLVTKGMEGVIRQLLMAKKRCDVVILGVGCNERGSTGGMSGLVDLSLHRKIAEHYDLPFIDLQSYIHSKLRERGQNWDGHIAPEVEHDPVYHLNDYGNEIYFEAIAEAFGEQVDLYERFGRKGYTETIAEPIVSDELQFVKFIDPAKKNSPVKLEGQWDNKPDELLPWYCDNILIGQPGAKMTLTFNGTAVMVWALMQHNGLKVDAVLDGKEIYGPYLKFPTESGKGFVIAHGLPNGEHILELTVAAPSKRHNKLENPIAQISGFGIATKGK